MRLEHPEAGKIQQGAIFNCVVVQGYEGCKCSGMILTARCDLEHNKHSVLNYIPIVRFSDWVARSYCHILARRARKELSKDIAEKLTKRRVSEKIRDTFPLVDIIEREMQEPDKKHLLDKCAKLKLFEKVESLGGGFCSDAKEAISGAAKHAKAIVSELIEQKLGEYYFLERVDIFGRETEGYVALLRNMRTLDCGLMWRINEGLEKGEAASQPGFGVDITFDHEPICMVTGVLRSPDIEHLAQQFANLFVRIGLEDQNNETVKKHHELITTL